ncbi:hemerythrin domain-containing protein [Streptosporangium sp. NPDC005286]|uniref:hemerythrin domain-containing protein n=1 Tax=Streptosporangium sp. NPDC005286 TaxID=3154463 RepID=UPI0033A3A1CB
MTTKRPPSVPQIRLPGQAAAVEGPLDMTNIYLAHYGFRRDLGRLLTAVCQVRLTDRGRVRALAKHLKWVLLVLHHHHSSQGTTVSPLLRQRAPEATGMIDSLEAEHREIDRWIGETQSAFTVFERHPTEERRARLTGALRSLADTLGAHLTRQETEGIPLMMTHITPEEAAKIERDIRRLYGLRSLTELVAWIGFDLPADVEEHLRRHAPRDLLLLRKLAGRRYRRRMAYLWS